jgi:hypothetical protein
MKKIVTGILLFIICSSPVFVRAQQGPVNDRYPEAAIYVVDPQTGQETPDGSDGAILFKDALLTWLPIQIKPGMPQKLSVIKPLPLPRLILQMVFLFSLRCKARCLGK